MIGNFCVIKDTLTWHDEFFVLGMFCMLTKFTTLLGDGVYGLVNVSYVVFWEVAGVCSRVGQHLVLLVKCLG